MLPAGAFKTIRTTFPPLLVPLSSSTKGVPSKFLKPSRGKVTSPTTPLPSLSPFSFVADGPLPCSSEVPGTAGTSQITLVPPMLASSFRALVPSEKVSQMVPNAAYPSETALQPGKRNVDKNRNKLDDGDQSRKKRSKPLPEKRSSSNAASIYNSCAPLPALKISVHRN